MAKDKLPTNREAVLLAALVNGEKYGREIRDEFERRCGQQLPLGSLYTTLDRMTSKGFLKSRWGESGHERGGNRRKYYKISASGEAALASYETWAISICGLASNA